MHATQVGLVAKQKTGTAGWGKRGSRVRGTEGVRTKEEAVREWAEATEVVSSERKQEDLLVDEVLEKQGLREHRVR